MIKAGVVVASLMATCAVAKDAVPPVKVPALSPVHEAAMLDCNVAARRFKQSTWGSREITIYRSCMDQKGYRE